MRVWISKIVGSIGLVLSSATVALAQNETSPITDAGADGTATTGANVTLTILLALGIALVVTVVLSYIKHQKTHA